MSKRLITSQVTMQTFLPIPDYLKSMRCLDKSRLGNQVWREGMTLIRGGWPNHPANKMWKGHEYHLGLYLLAGIEVLKERGKYYEKIHNNILMEMSKHIDTGAPPWFGNARRCARPPPARAPGSLPARPSWRPVWRGRRGPAR